MKASLKYDEPEINRLYERLLRQKGSAFYCVTINAALSHVDIANTLCRRLKSSKVQVIDFAALNEDFLFSSDFLRKSIKDNVSIVFLCNFHMACKKVPEDDFFQILNLSRDALAELPVVFVFMIPLYFRTTYAFDINICSRYNTGHDKEAIAMMYPYITLPDETLITHSHLIESDGEKSVLIHFERPTQDGFDIARCTLPSYEWIIRDGFTDEEISFFEQLVQTSAHTFYKYAELGGLSIAKAV